MVWAFSLYFFAFINIVLEFRKMYIFFDSELSSVCLLSSLSQTAEVYNNFAYFFAYLFLLCSCIGTKIQGTSVFSKGFQFR